MLWKEVKSWAKEKGYKADRTKITGETNAYDYVWIKIDDPSVSGTATSVSKLAFSVYNHITDNQHLAYQEEYKTKLSLTDIVHETGFGFQ